MFHGEKIVESVRSASAPEEGELLIRLPVEHAHRAKTIWLEKLFGKLLDPDLAGPIRRAVQGVRSVQTTACAPAGSGGPSPPWWSLLQGCRASESESEGVRRDHAMRRDHLWAPRPHPVSALAPWLRRANALISEKLSPVLPFSFLLFSLYMPPFSPIPCEGLGPA
jgi:hypothetical protein